MKRFAVAALAVALGACSQSVVKNEQITQVPLMKPAAAPPPGTAPLPLITALPRKGMGVDGRVYRVDWGNEGVGGSAQRVPGYIHVLGKSGDGSVEQVARHGTGIALSEERTRVGTAQDGHETEKSSEEAIDPLFRKYCDDPTSLTPEERRAFEAKGGVRAIPASLAKTCSFDK